MKQKLIKLTDGTDANYFEINWKYQSLGLFTVGVFSYKNKKSIGALAYSHRETPIEYLADMVTSLKFKK